MRCPSIITLLGFLFGCCITVIFALLVIPSEKTWPSIYEDRLGYLQELVMTYNYTFRSGRYMYDSSAADRAYDTEEDYLTRRAKMLCYSIGAEADDATHISVIIRTWTQHCDLTLIFHDDLLSLQKSLPQELFANKIKLIYVNSGNSTIGVLLKTLNAYLREYSWFTYVPSRVFLLPNNLKYFLLSANADPHQAIFVGKPHVGKLFGYWEVSEESPLAISVQAVSVASNTASSCFSDDIQDPGCLVEATKGRLVNIRNAEGNEVITSMLYRQFWLKFLNSDVKDKIKMRFPVSVHVQGDYNYLMDLEYYFHHLSSYGTQSILGGFTRPRKS
ncbi:uncharacterized protein [Watersipora subatra]|uniref:uncharacterized protein n=1 Tax=Watersipora subatra TaxID=2589382 RepID=UPI00355C682F